MAFGSLQRFVLWGGLLGTWFEATAQLSPDTTIYLNGSPALVAFFGLQDAPFADVFSNLAEDRRHFQRELEGALPRLTERGVEVHDVYGSTARLLWQDREWVTPSMWTGFYLWSPEGPHYKCGGLTSNAPYIEHYAALYLHMLRTGIERNLLRYCSRVPG